MGGRVLLTDVQPDRDPGDHALSERANGRHAKFFGVEPNYSPSCTYKSQVLAAGKTLVLRNLRKQELNQVYADLTAGHFLIQQTVHNQGNNYTVTSLCVGA